MNIVADIFSRATPQDIAIMSDAIRLSFADLDRLSAKVATGLKARIPTSGARVGLHCPDGFDYVVTAIAILRAGFCLVPIASELTARERENVIELTALAAVIDHQPQPDVPLAESALTACDHVQLLEVATPEWEDNLRQLDPAFIRFSSGTTGNRKGVVISHQTLKDRICAANASLAIAPNDRVLWVLPMAHHFAVSLILYLWHGATTVLPTSHLASDLLDAATRHHVSVLYAAPFHFQILAAEPSPRSWPDLRLAVATAARLDTSVAEAFRQRYGISPSQALGIIEVGLSVTNIVDPTYRPQSVGLPQPDFSMELRDSHGKCVGTGSPGELFLRGPGIFDAYLHPWRLRKDVLEDGWFHTGDIGICDADGFLTLQGRSHSVLNIGGMKCFPEEVEETLRSHADVLEVRVIGREHPQFGLLPVAEVVPCDPKNPPTKRELLQHCRTRLSAYKVPVELHFISAVPRTVSGKIARA